MTTIPFGAQLIGRTEKALDALLHRALAGTGLSEPQWVVLTLTVTADGTSRASRAAEGTDPAARIAEALQVGEAEARRRLAELAAAGLVRSDAGRVEATERGVALWREVRTQAARVADEL